MRGASRWGEGEAEMGAWIPQGYEANKEIYEIRESRFSLCGRELQIFKRKKQNKTLGQTLCFWIRIGGIDVNRSHSSQYTDRLYI